MRLAVLAVERALGLLHQPFVGAHQEAAGAAGRVADGEVRGLPRGSGFMHAHDGLDQHARREVLARALLAFARRLLQQALEGRALHVHVHGGPLFLVDQGDEPLEVDRVVEARHGLGEDVAEKPAGLAQLAQDVR